jgi:hypothetical protein
MLSSDLRKCILTIDCGCLSSVAWQRCHGCACGAEGFCAMVHGRWWRAGMALAEPRRVAPGGDRPKGVVPRRDASGRGVAILASPLPPPPSRRRACWRGGPAANRPPHDDVGGLCRDAGRHCHPSAAIADGPLIDRGRRCRAMASHARRPRISWPTLCPSSPAPADRGTLCQRAGRIADWPAPSRPTCPTCGCISPPPIPNTAARRYHARHAGAARCLPGRHTGVRG